MYQVHIYRQVSHTRDECFDLSLPLPAAHKGDATGKLSQRQLGASHGAAANGTAGGAEQDAPPPLKAARAGLGGTINRSLSLFGINKFLGHSSSHATAASGQPAHPSSKPGAASLADCLDAFFATEHLEGDEQYKCDHCKSLQNCHKSLKLLHLPPVLALQAAACPSLCDPHHHRVPLPHPTSPPPPSRSQWISLDLTPARSSSASATWVVWGVRPPTPSRSR